MAVNMQQVTDWMRQADALFQTPIVRQMLVPMLKAVLPPLGVTPAQIATLDAHYADLTSREADALRRAKAADEDDGA